ncbi:hypothetical protein Patl1_05475 [Pistacia atlantica]|uniref:Uncharacterized protein n=1 Tax=Pistacia atlantica TaxID=434234 RepID=A0ACC1BU37_9ROSI|nr:hypothetical protein Patl1_05475 [Pistacia atlantica]
MPKLLYSTIQRNQIITKSHLNFSVLKSGHPNTKITFQIIGFQISKQ